MNDRIYLSPPHMGGEEIKYIKKAFALNWISPAGPQLDEFENKIAQYVGIPHVAAVSSGTAALHLALILLGIQRGDEVMCQSFTFCGSANPILYQGAEPVFVDSELQTWNMDPEALEEGILDRIKRGIKPKAIIYVHLYGMPAKVAEIKEVSLKYEIPLIEDAAEALGATYFDTPLGTFGDVSFFSFNGNKIITTSGGGALVSANEKYIASAKFLATQARDPAPHYEHSTLGYNYRLSNISAAIGIGQMKVLDKRVDQRRRVFEKYKKAFSQIKEIQFLTEPIGHFSNRWLTTILLPDEGIRDAILHAMTNQNIEARPLWKPMHLQPLFNTKPFYGSGVSDDLFARGMCLPSGTSMDKTDLERIIETVLTEI